MEHAAERRVEVLTDEVTAAQRRVEEAVTRGNVRPKEVRGPVR